MSIKTNLTREPALAEELEIPLQKFQEMRRRRGWPCVKFGRFDIRYTADQVAQIIAMQTQGPKPRGVVGNGQTARSARRSS